MWLPPSSTVMHLVLERHQNLVQQPRFADDIMDDNEQFQVVNIPRLSCKYEVLDMTPQIHKNQAGFCPESEQATRWNLGN